MEKLNNGRIRRPYVLRSIYMRAISLPITTYEQTGEESPGKSFTIYQENKMRPGRELDALVAEKVMKARWAQVYSGPRLVRFLDDGSSLSCSFYSTAPKDLPIEPIHSIKPYSESLEAALSVHNHLDTTNPALEFVLKKDYEGLWSCTFKGSLTGSAINCNTAAHAICLAALEAVK